MQYSESRLNAIAQMLPALEQYFAGGFVLLVGELGRGGEVPPVMTLPQGVQVYPKAQWRLLLTLLLCADPTPGVLVCVSSRPQVPPPLQAKHAYRQWRSS